MNSDIKFRASKIAKIKFQLENEIAPKNIDPEDDINIIDCDEIVATYEYSVHGFQEKIKTYMTLDLIMNDEWETEIREQYRIKMEEKKRKEEEERMRKALIIEQRERKEYERLRAKFGE